MICSLNNPNLRDDEGFRRMAALVAIDHVFRMWARQVRKDQIPEPSAVGKLSVDYADALLAELRKGEKK